jgi:DNA mismatch endonuclease (patch repair protein)
MDTISKTRRSANMASIRSKDTKPELRVRRALHSAGFRYRLHAGKLPGRPDLVFKSRRTVVFVHGCFWHGCSKCVDGTRAVKSNSEYWKSKIAMNRERDERNRAKLVDDGWRVLEIWECQVDDAAEMSKLVASLRDSPKFN